MREKTMLHPNPTRGSGLLERWLAQQRGKVADRLIPQRFRKGRILDIGCGAFPIFLATIQFSEKYGLDQLPHPPASEIHRPHRIHYVSCNVAETKSLPFSESHFDVVTMLAVLEHIEPKQVPALLLDIHRVLKPGGLYILTTPAPWANALLKAMAKLRLVSPEEIEEHKEVYNHHRISSLLEKAAFPREKIWAGYFELFMNVWAVAEK